MRLTDIARLSVNNLFRRKGRTLLTVSGVVIGCCAVVIMISMGIGMKRSQDELLRSMGNLMQITVTPAPGSARRRTLLDGSAGSEFKKLSGVTLAVPKKTMDLGELKLTAGDGFRYVCEYVTVVGIPEVDLENAGYQLKEGKMPGGRQGDVLVGANLAFQFADSKRPEGCNMVDYWSDEEVKPYFSILQSDLTLAQKKEQDTGSEDGAEQIMQSVSWKPVASLRPVGVISSDYELGEETDSGIVMRLSDFEKLQKTTARMGGEKPGIEYQTVIVTVKELGDVAPVESAIREMGFGTYSMESIRKPMEQSTRQKQLMLAGLGAVSLFVAAIGIANTMIMSITERTREIGILKAIGCELADIRREFLLEAGMIGILGGAAGSGVSCLISWIMNTYGSVGASAAGDSFMYMEESSASLGSLSVIPPWLIAFAILFSMLMGIGAGYLPANRAVHISALEAMKN